VAINYLTYHQIDKAKWDACIDQADNGLIYAYSFYLDSMAKNWDALVLNDYEALMPLTWNKKYGIHYLYQPPFTACLGVFGRSVTAEMLQAFLKAVPDKFKYWDIYFNPGNFFNISEFKLYERMNFILKLDTEYDKLLDGYRDNIKRNIRKSEQLQLAIHRDITIDEVIKLSQQQAGSFSSLAGTDYLQFEKLFRLLYSNKKATTYGVYTKEGMLIASAVFFFSHNRAYYIMVGNHPNGKTLGASHALIDAFIKDHAGENMLLDFEGSDVSSLAFFYGSFGATEEKYSAVKLNKLPAAVKWLKK
jgi:hypothetical protein